MTTNSSRLDADFYLATNEDVRVAGMDPAVHYWTHGRAERRYANPQALEADIAIIEKSRRFDHRFYAAATGISVDQIRHYLLGSGAAPNREFDRDFFLDYYSDSLAVGEPPFVFFCRFADHPWCHPNADAAEAEQLVVAASELFDATYYATRYLAGRAHLNPATHYLVEGFRTLASPSPRLHGPSFAAANPDLASAELNPIIHWERHGRSEGRLAIGTADIVPVKGGQDRDPDRPTVLIVSHEASRTGAPVVVLNLLRHLSQRFNMVTLSQRGGALAHDFRHFSVAYVEPGEGAPRVAAAVARLIEDYAPDVAILNSIVSSYNIWTYFTEGLGIVTLVHDFATYVRPSWLVAQALLLSDQVVFPATVVRESALDALADLGMTAPLTNLHVRPQGRSMLPPRSAGEAGLRALDPIKRLRAAGVRIVIGAGYVQLRKGVDLFIETARQAAARDEVDMHFVWVGAGYDPLRDDGLSVFLRDQVARSHLTRSVTFLPEMEDLGPLFELGDVFLLSSRLDPYPNVALDAASAGMPVVCFQRATGIADLAAEFPPLFHAVPYNDTRCAAETIATLLQGDAAGLRDAREAFLAQSEFANYAGYIAQRVDAARDRRDARLRHAAALLEGGAIDPDVFVETAPSWLRRPGADRSGTMTDLAGLAAALDRNGYDRVLLDERTLSSANGAPVLLRTFAPRLDDAPDAATVETVAIVEDDDSGRVLAARLFEQPALDMVTVVAGAGDMRPVEADRLLSTLPLRRGGPAGEPASVIHLWRVRPGKADRDLRRWSRAAAAAFAATPGLSVLFLRAEPGAASPDRTDGARAPASVAGLPFNLVDPDHLWVFGLDEAARAALINQLSAIEPDLRSDLMRLAVADLDLSAGQIGLLARGSRPDPRHGQIVTWSTVA